DLQQYRFDPADRLRASRREGTHTCRPVPSEPPSLQRLPTQSVTIIPRDPNSGRAHFFDRPIQLRLLRNQRNNPLHIVRTLSFANSFLEPSGFCKKRLSFKADYALFDQRLRLLVPFKGLVGRCRIKGARRLALEPLQRVGARISKK